MWRAHVCLELLCLPPHPSIAEPGLQVRGVSLGHLPFMDSFIQQYLLHWTVVVSESQQEMFSPQIVQMKRL